MLSPPYRYRQSSQRKHSDGSIRWMRGLFLIFLLVPDGVIWENNWASPPYAKGRGLTYLPIWGLNQVSHGGEDATAETKTDHQSSTVSGAGQSINQSVNGSTEAGQASVADGRMG